MKCPYLENLCEEKMTQSERSSVCKNKYKGCWMYREISRKLQLYSQDLKKRLEVK